MWPWIMWKQAEQVLKRNQSITVSTPLWYWVSGTVPLNHQIRFTVIISKWEWNTIIKNQQKHHDLGDFKHMMDESCSRFIIKEGVMAQDMHLNTKSTSEGNSFIFGSPLPSEFCADNEGEQKMLEMEFAVFLACYSLWCQHILACACLARN